MRAALFVLFVILVLAAAYHQGMSFRRHCSRFGHRLLATENAGAAAAAAAAAAAGPAIDVRVKRKVALVLGYVGSSYYGLQMDPNSTLPTIESIVEAALGKLGCILPSNRRQLQKIGWSRSSRTDKGVHAARTVVSGKLEIDERAWLKGRDSKAPSLAAMLNAELPPDIRCFAAAKMNQGFRARESCHFREYEYMIPLDLLTDPGCGSGGKSWRQLPTSASEAVDSLNAVFSKLVGSHSYHNFHKLSPKSLRTKPQINGDAEEDEVEEDEEKGKEEQRAYVFNHFDPWVRRERLVVSKTRSTIYSFKADEQVKDVGNLKFVLVRVRGQAFLLHQIRLMIASAVLQVRGVVPQHTLDVALQIPLHVNFPLAPAEGLALVDAGFSRNANGKTVSIRGTPGVDADYVIFEDDEWEKSEEWKIANIHAKIADDFRDGKLVSSFLEYSERFRVPESVATEWTELMDKHREVETGADAIRAAREAARIAREVMFFRSELIWRDERWAHLAPQVEEKGGKRRHQAIPHKKLLPNSIATALVIRFGVLPSSVLVSDTLVALATRMVLSNHTDENDLSPEMSVDEIVDFVARSGGLPYWSAQPRHAMIE